MTANQVVASEPTAENVATWLKSLKHIHDVSVARVSLQVSAKITLEVDAVFYKNAVFDGAPYLYLLLNPYADKFLLRTRHSCWKAEDGREWFKACYSPEVITPQFAHAHPFGHSVIMRVWDADEPIDKYETTPYRRLDLKVLK
jgi:hypothetical protein